MGMQTAPHQYFTSTGLNTYLNPLNMDGALVHSVNMDSFPYGAKTKRAGYGTIVGTLPAGVQSLWSFAKNDGTTLFTYAKAGSLIYYSAQGTGAWTVAGNGTVDANSHVGYAILNNTMIIGDAVGSTRHTTNGTSFTNTTLAPVGQYFEQYQNRVYLMGTSSTLFYSTTNDASNWNLSGTADSSSLEIPGPGVGGRLFKAANQLVATKTSGLVYRWDGFSLRDMATKFGPSSPYSVDQIEDYWFFVNAYGHYGFNGDKPQLLSNAVQRQFYNNNNTGISGTQIVQVPAVCHRYDYMAAIGTITDDFTNIQIPDAILKYDYNKNEYLNYRYVDFPTALHSYRDLNNVQQLIFGDSTGKVYQVNGTATTDNGSPIPTEMIYIYTYGAPEYDKTWRWWRGVFNPGCQAQVQVACVDDYLNFNKNKWQEIIDTTAGVVEAKFPPGNRSKFLLVRIYETGKAARYTYYGCSVDAEINIQK